MRSSRRLLPALHSVAPSQGSVSAFPPSLSLSSPLASTHVCPPPANRDVHIGCQFELFVAVETEEEGREGDAGGPRGLGCSLVGVGVTLTGSY